MTLSQLLDDLESKAKAATPGPWLVDQCGDIWSDKIKEMDEDLGGMVGRRVASSARAPNDPNGIYIATCNPENILRLVKTLRRYRSTLKKMYEEDGFCLDSFFASTINEIEDLQESGEGKE